MDTWRCCVQSLDDDAGDCSNEQHTAACTSFPFFLLHNNPAGSAVLPTKRPRTASPTLPGPTARRCRSWLPIWSSSPNTVTLFC